MFQPSIPFSPGDSLTKIAHDQLGDSSKWRELADFNGVNIFDKIPIGKNLDIPSPGEMQQMALAQVQNLIGGNLPGLGAIAGNLNSLVGGAGLGDLDLSSIAEGQFHTALMRKLGMQNVNQQIKLVDWLY